jgi:hypothetical protein
MQTLKESKCICGKEAKISYVQKNDEYTVYVQFSCECGATQLIPLEHHCSCFVCKALKYIKQTVSN